MTGAATDCATTMATTRACALNGDMERTRDVLRRMKANTIEPTPNTWRAKKARRPDVAETAYPSRDVTPFEPQASDVALLLSVYVSELRGTSDILNKWSPVNAEKLGVVWGGVYVCVPWSNYGFYVCRLVLGRNSKLHRNLILHKLSTTLFHKDLWFLAKFRVPQRFVVV